MTATPSHVRLANDIAAQFAHLPPDKGATNIAAHMRMFWDPRMRRALIEHVDGGGEGLDPLAVSAAGLLRQPA